MCLKSTRRVAAGLVRLEGGWARLVSPAQHGFGRGQFLAGAGFAVAASAGLVAAGLPVQALPFTLTP